MERQRQHTSTTDLPLTADGEAAALKLVDALSGIDFEQVLTSPRQRAVRTAELAGFPDAEVDADLVEWAYGDYEGLTTVEIRETVPGWTVWTHPSPGGETGEQVSERLDRVIAKARAVEGKTLVFAHGHSLRALAVRWLGPRHRRGPALRARHLDGLGARRRPRHPGRTEVERHALGWSHGITAIHVRGDSTMVKKLVVVIAALVLVTGCGGSAEPEAQSPPKPKTYTAAQLEAAMPKVADISGVKDQTAKCPGDETCIEPEEGVELGRTFSLKLPFTGAEAEKAAADGIADYLAFTVTQRATATAATTELAKDRKEQSRYDGKFDEKAVKTGKGFTFGLRGTGVMADATVAKWPGFELERDMTLTNLDGGDEGNIRDYQLRARRGPVTIYVQVGSEQGERTLKECEKIARAVAKDYIARLG